MRLQQLKQEKQQKTSLESQGHGVLTEVSQAHCQASNALEVFTSQSYAKLAMPVRVMYMVVCAGSDTFTDVTVVPRVSGWCSGDLLLPFVTQSSCMHMTVVFHIDIGM